MRRSVGRRRSAAKIRRRRFSVEDIRRRKFSVEDPQEKFWARVSEKSSHAVRRGRIPCTFTEKGENYPKTAERRDLFCISL